jgi:hypothetical protein
VVDGELDIIVGWFDVIAGWPELWEFTMVGDGLPLWTTLAEAAKDDDSMAEGVEDPGGVKGEIKVV